jgi:acyl-coenzyme A thioesterase PaaI-like protein
LPSPRLARIVVMVKAMDLAFSRALGLRDAPPNAEHLLELPFTGLLHNHLGTMHAAAQFSLAEAASAECLQRRYGASVGEVFAVVRGVEVKYRKPATGDLLAYGRPDEATAAHLLSELADRGRTNAVILIDLKDRSGTLTFHGKFEWFISRVPPPQL